MKIGQLREAVNLIGKGHDNDEVRVWLPGLYIELQENLWKSAEHGWLIEGNVESVEPTKLSATDKDSKA